MYDDVVHYSTTTIGSSSSTTYLTCLGELTLEFEATICSLY